MDFDKRFPSMTYQDMLDAADATEDWVFPELISSATTMIYGRSNVGKSFLVASMLLSLMLRDREFLGVQPADKEWRPVLLCTDPGSQIEYGKRLRKGTGEVLDVESYFVGTTRHAEEWVALTDRLLDDGRNFVVLDNLMGATGDTNESAAITTVFDGLNAMVLRGAPAVIIHHETEHGYSLPGGPPMGISNSTQKSRCWIQVRQTQKRDFRGGNAALIVQSNHLDQPREIIARPLPGPDYEVLSNRPWEKKTTEEKPKQDRAAETYDINAEMADYVVRNCQHKGVNATAAELAEKYPKSKGTLRQDLMGGMLGALLERSGSGTDTVWTRR